MKLIFAALLCTIVAIAIARYAETFEDELSQLPDPKPSYDEAQKMRLEMFDLEASLKNLVDCLGKATDKKSEERCFKKILEHLKPYPDKERCFEDLENCYFSDKMGFPSCLEDLRKCAAPM